MGTNYYLHTNYCPCCGKPREEIHLGKSSIGWKFLFHKTKQVYNYKSFCKFIKTGNIYNEYGEKVNDIELLDYIKTYQQYRHHPNCEIIDGYDFIGGDFC